jgi:hypothetical protein
LGRWCSFFRKQGNSSSNSDWSLSNMAPAIQERHPYHRCSPKT